MRGICPWSAYFLKYGLANFFVPGLALNCNHPISASGVAVITDMYHYAWLRLVLKKRTQSCL
jgi:hypothetical protein